MNLCTTMNQNVVVAHKTFQVWLMSPYLSLVAFISLRFHYKNEFTMQILLSVDMWMPHATTLCKHKNLFYWLHKISCVCIKCVALQMEIALDHSILICCIHFIWLTYPPIFAKLTFDWNEHCPHNPINPFLLRILQVKNLLKKFTK